MPQELYRLRLLAKFGLWNGSEIVCAVLTNPKRKLAPCVARLWRHGQYSDTFKIVAQTILNPTPPDGSVSLTVAGLPHISEEEILSGSVEVHGMEVLPEVVATPKPDDVTLYDDQRAIEAFSFTFPSAAFVNRCPACNRVVRTPEAKQCFWCGHDWHK